MTEQRARELLERIPNGMDPDGLNRWREKARETPGHDMCGANANTLHRLIVTIDHLATALAESAKSPSDSVREALEPFSTFADTFIDEEGWNGPMRTTRIVDWFGPSDFRRARAALQSSEADNG